MKILITCCLLMVTLLMPGRSFACNEHTLSEGKPFYYYKISALISNSKNAKSTTQLQTIVKQIALLAAEELRDTCREPKNSDFKSFCSDITTKAKASGSKTDTVEYVYEQRLWEVACAVMGVDDLETAKIKIQKWWNKYKTKCKCDSLGFNLPNGNLLKFSIAQSMPDFMDKIVSTYGLDINFKDPADGKNVLDYLNDEIEKYKKTGVSQSSIKIYEDYRVSLIKLGAKPSK